MHKFIYITLIISTFSFVFNNETNAQVLNNHLVRDTIAISEADSVIMSVDTIRQYSIPSDSLAFSVEQASDTITDEESSLDSDIKFAVDYVADDSVKIITEDDGVRVFLYRNGKVIYGDVELTADYIEFDMRTSEVYAKGLPDSTGKIAGKPYFKDAQQELNANELRYNFKTGKGKIYEVKVEQEGGWLHATQTKKDEKGHIHIKDGKYTTCDADHPHFYIALTKAKSIPGDKIISGPAYLVIEDVPFPVGLPFGFFPNTKTNTSGILIPQYGEESGRGFFLRNGGYYLAISDYIDATITGDIYTNGTWGLRLGTKYKKRYKFGGSFNGRIYQNISGEKGLSDYTKSTDYSIQWSHNQDSKANPNQRFSASVNLSSRKFDEQHSRVLTNALTNTKSSSISYQKSWANLPINFSASANHSQNSNTKMVNMNLPKMSFNVSRIYPFRFKNNTGKGGFWEDIQLSYSSTLDNRITTYDSLLFTSSVFDNMKNGFSHNIPLTWNYKPKKLRNFTFSPNLSYKGVAYTQKILKKWESFYHESEDSTYYDMITDTIKGLSYAHAFYPSFSASLTPKVYFDYTFIKETSKIQAIRHVMSPSVSFSYIPDMSKLVPDYYRELYDENGELISKYSIYEGGIYGTPSLSSSSKTMSFSLKNNIEAKIRQDQDTAMDVKKIKLIDNLNFGSSMNFDDSIKFNPISFNGSTRFFDGKLNLNFRGNMDPYALDSLYRRINVSEFSQSGKLVRLTAFGVSAGLNLRGGAGKKTEGGDQEKDDFEADNPRGRPGSSDEYDPYNEDYAGEYVDFNIPWTLRIDYSLNYTKSRGNKNLIQTIRLSGDFSLTPKWKIGYNTGYDIKNHKVTTSNMSIYRDLHCWEMRLTAVPFGKYKSFNFQINAKSAILQDLKYNKRIPWQDNF